MAKKSSEPQAQKKQLINAHTHVFTGNFVPPYLARSIVPSPLYYLLHVGFVIRLFKAYYAWKWKMYGPLKNLKRRRVLLHNFIRSKPVLNFLYRIVLLWLGVVATLIFIEWFRQIVSPSEKINNNIDSIINWLTAHYLYFDLPWAVQLIWFLLIFVFVKWSRNFLLFIVKNIWGFLKKLPNENTLALLNRYLLLGRFAFYKNQANVAERALHQLPPNSGMVILPMDMEYMGAGKTKMPKAILNTRTDKIKDTEDDKDGWRNKDFQDVYKYQMRELWEFTRDGKKKQPKEKYYPFLFLDPRRIAEENTLAKENPKENEPFFDYEIVADGQKMKLKPCFVKTYMEDRRFSGFKIYPALGYYPFDEQLLPIWRYAQENNIPIMTHCVKGVVYYRGPKKEEWNNHPVFREEFDDTLPMLLPEVKNIDFQINFTHPMNYLCLVEEWLLREVVQNTHQDSPVRKLFPFDEDKKKLQYDLSGLKICLAHFGGEGEWTRYMEQDRETYSQRLLKDPEEGINFILFKFKDECEKLENCTEVKPCEAFEKCTKNKRCKKIEECEMTEKCKKVQECEKIRAISWNKLHQIWHKADWYSIISSMLIDYQHIYADISYIISKESIYPLLKYTLEKGDHFEKEMEAYEKEKDPVKKATLLSGKNKLRSRVLFGTDFYVVRNHHSDKDLFIKTKSLLSEEQFDLIARENTHLYLQRSYSEPRTE